MLTRFLREYLEIAQVCEHNGLDYEAVMDAISDSDVSFGINADTFITGEWLNNLLEKQLDYGVSAEDSIIAVAYKKPVPQVFISLGS